MANLITAITGVFDDLSEWLVGAVGSVTGLFYDSTSGLTFLGTLAIIGLGISVIFLLIGIVQKFLHFAG